MAVAPVALRCEYQENPIGLGYLKPRLSWQLSDTRRGARQTAYQVRVGTAAELGDMWDSGKVDSDQSVQIDYAGAKLKSRQRYYWQVKVWDQDGAESPWSAVAFWEMGLLSPKDWVGQWINLPSGARENNSPSPYLRRSFDLKKPIASARLYITARGLYEPYINGQRIGRDIFTPGWTDYKKRLRYQTYDVTAMLQQGSNAMGAILANGWFAGTLAWQGNHNIYGTQLQLLAQLVVRYQDGTQETIATDGNWRATTGPIESAEFYHGESYDARKEFLLDGNPNGWALVNFDASAWTPVETSPRDEVALIAQVGPTVQQTQELPVKEMWPTADGKWILDLGQNMVGWARLKIAAPAGTLITLRFAEMLNPDKTIYTTNLRGAKCTDTYTCNGRGAETYEPRFTSHGFRYVEISGLPASVKPNPDTITGIVIHSATPPTGQFTCSHAKLNQLQSNIQWGQRGNFVEVPTDCPQRDERLGWMGDAQVFCATATFNMDVAGFFNKWMLDVTDAQLPDGAFTDVVPDVLSKGKVGEWGSGAAAWGDAGVIIPWTIFVRYGDKRILTDNYPAMAKFIKYMENSSKNLVRPNFGYGDWLAINSHTPKDLIATAYFAYSTKLMAKTAAVLGKKSDAKKYDRLFAKIKAAFNKEFVTSNGRILGESQTAYVLALRFDLLSDTHRQATIERLAADIKAKGVLTTGFVGCNLLLPTLSEIGRDDLAIQLLLNEKFPSWLYSVINGATTIWERWDGWTEHKGFQDAGMNSFNHYAYGAVGEWMYEHLGAIAPDETQPGYKHLRIAPVMGGGLTSANASLQTLYGPVTSSWKIENGTLTLDVTLPANTTATVMLPTADATSVQESGVALAQANGVSTVTAEGRAVRCQLVAGQYRFTLPAPQVA